VIYLPQTHEDIYICYQRHSLAIFALSVRPWFNHPLPLSDLPHQSSQTDPQISSFRQPIPQRAMNLFTTHLASLLAASAYASFPPSSGSSSLGGGLPSSGIIFTGGVASGASSDDDEPAGIVRQDEVPSFHLSNCSYSIERMGYYGGDCHGHQLKERRDTKSS
jgi:hypothetical protein